MNIIGINGFKRVGKGETGDAIARNYPGTVKQIGFADALKVLGMQALGFDRSRQELIDLADSIKIDANITIDYYEPPRTGAEPVLHDTTGRGFQQQLGTRGREVIGENVWIDLVLPNPSVYEAVPPHPETGEGGVRWQRLVDEALTVRYPGVDCLAITDLRFENEALRVLALGGEVWEVTRPGTASDGHASEQPLPRALISRKIANDGTLAELEDKVAVALVEVTA